MTNKTPGNKRRFTNWIRSLKKEKDQFRRKVMFIGYLFGELSRLRVSAYLVGGQAVEIYTGGQFSTGDVDITTGDSEETAKLLLRLGFAKVGMIWLQEDLGIAVQIVGSYPSRTEKVRTLNIDGNEVKVVGVEDLIIDRLVASKYWRSNPKLDLEQATVLMDEFSDSLDLKYLQIRAVEEKVDDYLKTISRTVSKSRKFSKSGRSR